jgi:hypothetical protein
VEHSLLRLFCAAAFCCLADGIELDLGQLPRDKEIPNYDYPVRAAEPIILGMGNSVWRSMEVWDEELSDARAV